VGPGDLYKIHIQACSTSFVGSTGYGFGDIAMTPSGELYGIVGGNLYQVDTTDATTTLIGPSPDAGVSLVALNDTSLLSEGSSSLYAISTLDGSSTWIGNIGYTAFGDLTWYFGDLYMSTGTQLIRIDLADDYASILSVTPVGTVDPNMPACMGLVTAMVGDFISSIVGFHFPDLVCFSPVDGSYQVICQPSLPYDAPGAAWAPPAETPGIGCDAQASSMNDGHEVATMRAWVAAGRLEIRLTAGALADVCMIRDLSGRIVREVALAGSPAPSVDLSGLADGPYTVEVISGPRSFIGRFVQTSSP
jgi:hypothetical protein